MNICLFRMQHLRSITRCIVAFAMPCWLIIHTVLLFYMAEGIGRIVVFAIFITATSFLVMMTTNASKYNLMLALLTYVFFMLFGILLPKERLLI